jgi:hypothetical protein
MWDKLTVGQFISLYDIEANANLNIIEKQQKMLAIVDGKDEEYYDDFKYRDLMHEYAEKLAFFDNIPETKPVDNFNHALDALRYSVVNKISNSHLGKYSFR